ncbi:VOC family protein [Peribacillus sp. SCS-155]|uniref:VOC family protein n=1 Tax=Peribacillus sedimenti TaxID=3115297 RepID=UPI0039062C7D
MVVQKENKAISHPGQYVKADWIFLYNAVSPNGTEIQKGSDCLRISLDHVVHFVKNDPSFAIKEMEDRGWHAVHGGRHEKWGTYNSLMYAGLSYIEFLSVEDTAIARASDNPLIQLLLKDQEGLGQICLRTADISALKRQLAKEGFETGEILDAQRIREDGKVLQWKMLFIKKESGLPYPFFIQWGQRDEERLKDLKGSGILTAGQSRRKIAAVHFGVNDIESTIKEWEVLLGKPAGEIYIHNNCRCCSISLRSTELVFRQPISEGYVSNMLKLKGERPYLVVLGDNKESEEIYGALYRF